MRQISHYPAPTNKLTGAVGVRVERPVRRIGDMMMEHLNYSRQLVRQCMDLLTVPGIEHDRRALLSSVVDLHGSSTKFILPDGGRLYDDNEFRALDESVPLRLPYPCIALEYQSNGRDREMGEPVGHVNGVPQYESGDFVSAPKRVVYAREHGDYIVVTVAFWTRHDGLWRVMPECAIPNVGYLDRGMSYSGRTAIKAAFQNPRVPMSDYMDELGALLCFLNILHCSNVQAHRSDPKRAGKKIKSALPFDTYHILTIDVPGNSGGGMATGSHRSPREHLRRGHIRRLGDGRRIWVNATVVAAGRGAGVVTKDYAIRRAA